MRIQCKKGRTGRNCPSSVFLTSMDGYMEDTCKALVMVCSASEIDPEKQRAKTLSGLQTILTVRSIKMLHQLGAIIRSVKVREDTG